MVNAGLMAESAGGRLGTVILYSMDPTMKKRRIDELSSRIIADSVRDKQFKSKEELSEFIGKITEETRNEGTLLGWLPKTPGNQAFELIFQAWNESAKEKRAGLAQKMLNLWKNSTLCTTKPLPWESLCLVLNFFRTIVENSGK